MRNTTLAAIIVTLSIVMVHYMAHAEQKCAELGNTPLECALLLQ